MNNLVLAFFPEMAEFINQDKGLAATARSVLMDFDNLKGMVVIEEWEDHQSTLIPTDPSRKSLVFFTGRLVDDEHVQFTAHFGVHKKVNALRYDMDAEKSLANSDITWETKNDLSHSSPATHKFRYNLYDNAGLDCVFEWALQASRRWIHGSMASRK